MTVSSALQSLRGHLASAWARFRGTPLGHGRGALVLGSALVFLGFAGGGFAWGSWTNLCAECPSIAQIQDWEPQLTSKLYSHDGRMFAELGIERRTEVRVASLPPHVPQAVIAIEDKRFYGHQGYDVRALARAVFGRLTFRNLGGGSTITQQLARNMFIDEIGFEKRYIRKLKELQVAIQLEDVYTKDQILESYLNQIYMGIGASGSALYGFQAAALGYFGRDLNLLNPAESALLAAILNRPTVYSPFTRPEDARARRNLVLSQMAAQGYLAAEEAETWKEWPLPVMEEVGAGGGSRAPYFVEAARIDLDRRYGANLYTDGLKIYTTLDLDMQEAAEISMQEGWENLEGQLQFDHPLYEEFAGIDTVFAGGETPYLQGMFIAMDPADGSIRALIGGRDFSQSRFDRATQARRQPGSAFKPFVYTTALMHGIPASFVLDDSPYFEEQVDGTTWTPENYSAEFRGPLTIREGLRRSINTIAIRLGRRVSIETVRSTARSMGIRTEVRPFSSSFIGASEVIPIELLQAYSGIANLGEVVTPRFITRVEDAEGTVIWEPPVQRRSVPGLDPAAARIAVDMLEDVVTLGTGANIRNPAIAGLPAEIPAAGKTGTTNDGTNVWFMGFTPNLVAGVWFGMDRPQKIAFNATGGRDASPVWGRFMKRVYYGPEGDDAERGLLELPEPWPFPETLIRREVDSRTGLIASLFCPEDRAYVEWFIPGTEPQELCRERGGSALDRLRRGRGGRGGRGGGGSPTPG